jgi:hypothetical protein
MTCPLLIKAKRTLVYLLSLTSQPNPFPRCEESTLTDISPWFNKIPLQAIINLTLNLCHQPCHVIIIIIIIIIVVISLRSQRLIKSNLVILFQNYFLEEPQANCQSISDDCFAFLFSIRRELCSLPIHVFLLHPFVHQMDIV